jgi:hypothetical protein
MLVWIGTLSVLLSGLPLRIDPVGSGTDCCAEGKCCCSRSGDSDCCAKDSRNEHGLRAILVAPCGCGGHNKNGLSVVQEYVAAIVPQPLLLILPEPHSTQAREVPPMLSMDRKAPKPPPPKPFSC